MTELEEEEERSIEKRLAERVAVKLPLVLSPLSFSPLPVRTGEGEERRGETALRRLE